MESVLESVLGEERRKDLDGEGESRQSKSRQRKREARRTGTEKGRWSRSVCPMLDIVSLSNCTKLRHWVGGRVLIQAKLQGLRICFGLVKLGWDRQEAFRVIGGQIL